MPWRLSAGLLLAGGLAAGVALGGHASEPAAPAIAAAIDVSQLGDSRELRNAIGGQAQISRVEAPPTHSLQLQVVFRVAGSTYMKLADLDASTLPKHAAVRVVREDYIDAALARVRDADVPDAERAWAGRDVLVDNICHAKVTGFAIVARLTGDTAYAGVDAEAWSAETLLDKGSVILAARLDQCTGSWARDASLPLAVVPEEIRDATLASKARALVIASEPGSDTQKQWREFEQRGMWFDQATFATRVLRHPITGETWVSVHAHQDHGCGEPDVNVWGLFRVERDGSLTAVALRHLELDTIDQLLDVDGDGSFEILGRPWLGLDRVLETAAGQELDRLVLPYYGCPC